jgi:hypothetical protein
MSRQNRPRKGLSPRRSSYRDPYTLFVIASEGTETEPAYFTALQAHILKTPQLDVLTAFRYFFGKTHFPP